MIPGFGCRNRVSPMCLNDESPLHGKPAVQPPRLRFTARLATFRTALSLLLLTPSLIAADPQVRPPGESTAGQRLVFHVLGIAQDGGVPHLGCQKQCCRKARTDGLRLGPASAAVHDQLTNRTLLLEATPSIEEQLAMLPTAASSRRPVDRILLTHAHIGHYAGLIHLGREVASADGIPVNCSNKMSRYLNENGPWKQLVQLRQIIPEPATPMTRINIPELPELAITAIPVTHRGEYTDTVAWRIDAPGARIVFCPDVDRWIPEELQQLLDATDFLYLDATFYDGRELPGRDLSEIPHPPMVLTMQLLEQQARLRPGSIRFIHLNHTNPALFDEVIRDEIRSRGFAVAEAGETICLD